MENGNKLLNLKEVSKLLQINPEVLRRWLRNGKLRGVKVGSDWRVYESDIQSYLVPNSSVSNTKENKSSEGHPQMPDGMKMCLRFPKWLEFSGLPSMFNNEYGPEAWPVFKKLVELDFDAGRPADRKVGLDIPKVALMTGYDEETVVNVLEELEKAGYITVSDTKRGCFFYIRTPIRTPKLIFDIVYADGGIKGAPQYALENPCIRRFLES